MALDDTVMTATCIARAVSQGLIDHPPKFGLSRTYRAICKGVVTTLRDKTKTIITVTYGPGQPAAPFGTAGPTVGLNNLDPERFWPLLQASCGMFGPFAIPFFFGLGGIVEHVRLAASLTDLFAPTGTGTGLLPAGGIIVDPTAVRDNIRTEAIAEQIMVAYLKSSGPDGHLDTPTSTVPDPITGAPIGLDQLFTRPEIMLTAIGAQLAIELLQATKPGIPVAGPFIPPPVPPIVAASITAFLL